MTKYYLDGLHREKTLSETFNKDLPGLIKNLWKEEDVNISSEGNDFGQSKGSLDSGKLEKFISSKINGGNK
tara:strand:+ start:1113 stop:1325 length:213 start_codon:yes stop_codon:yes gene_type:complete